jgi:shikimate 5-dehydrogenase
MNQLFFLRQLDIADPSKFKDKPVTVIGAGEIGAATVVALAKTGFENITVYDFDTVEEHNFPNQLLPIWVGARTRCRGRKPPPCFTWSTTWPTLRSRLLTNATPTSLWVRSSSPRSTLWTHAGQSGLKFRVVWIPSSSWMVEWPSRRWTCTPSI